MILNDRKIKEYIKSGKIVVDPFDEEMIGPASLDIRLGYKFRVFKTIDKEVIDIKDYNDDIYTRIDTENYTIHVGKYSDLYIIKKDNIPIIIHPGEFILASVYEYIQLPNDIVGQIHGRSSIGRLGLIIHTSAGYIDPGYKGYLTLEIINVNKIPIKLYPKTKVAQIVFFDTEPVEVSYSERKSSKYAGEEGATQSLISKDFKQ
ncbi:dCTP deaminase, dUMP-forming [Nanoarchaeota archaeon]